jgi:hypothetical protein
MRKRGEACLHFCTACGRALGPILIHVQLKALAASVRSALDMLAKAVLA